MEVIKTSLSDLANDDPLLFNLFSWTFPHGKKIIGYVSALLVPWGVGWGGDGGGGGGTLSVVWYQQKMPEHLYIFTIRQEAL